jgi:hypothetical protein
MTCPAKDGDGAPVFAITSWRFGLTNPGIVVRAAEGLVRRPTP